MKVMTNLDVISEAWSLLDELGLAGLLLGKTTSFDAHELVGKLLGERELQRFLGIVTGADPAEIGKLDMGKAAELVRDFFMSMAGGFSALPGLAVTNPAAPAKAKAERKRTKGTE